MVWVIFDLLVLHILILSWIEPNFGQNTSPWDDIVERKPSLDLEFRM